MLTAHVGGGAAVRGADAAVARVVGVAMAVAMVGLVEVGGRAHFPGSHSRGTRLRGLRQAHTGNRRVR